MKTDSLHAGKVKVWQIGSILRQIFKNPGITRKELVENLGINRSMITRNINILKADNWLEITDNTSKSIPLSLNSNRFFAAGVDIQPETQIVVICNIEGDILHSHKWDEPVIDLLDFVNNKLKEYLFSLKIQIDVIGIAIPGIYNRTLNQLMSSQPFKILSPIMLPQSLNETPIFFDNNSRCCGLGIISFRKEKESFFLINCWFHDFTKPTNEYQRISIGTGIFLDGKAFEGSNFCSGEFKSIFQTKDGENSQLSMNRVNKVKIKSDSILLEKLIDELAVHVGFISNMIDVKKIYIGGSLEQHKLMVEKLFRTHLISNSVYPHIQKREIVYADMKEYSAAKGAAGMAFERILQEPSMKEINPFYAEILNRGQQKLNNDC